MANNKIKIQCTINGKKVVFNTYPMTRLLDAIREEALLTGTKEGCGEGECGACAILINGKLSNSCLVPVIQVDNCKLTTIEGLAKNDVLDKVQQAFLDNNGAQCGFCTPGMVMATHDLLTRHPNPKSEEIKEGLAGNLCRCTGYMKIFDAVKQASKKAPAKAKAKAPKKGAKK